jgi:hypothetical protein
LSSLVGKPFQVASIEAAGDGLLVEKISEGTYQLTQTIASKGPQDNQVIFILNSPKGVARLTVKVAYNGYTVNDAR